MGEFFAVLSILGGLGVMALAGWSVFMTVARKKRDFERAMNMALFMVSVPKEENQDKKEDKKDDKEIIGTMEQLLTSFYQFHDTYWREKLFGPPQIALEIANPSDDEAIYFYMAVPRRFATLAEKQVYGFYPKAVVERVHDFNIFIPTGFTSGTYLTLKSKAHLPIKTYKNLETDPLTNITNALSKLKRMEEGAAFQLVLRHTPMHWRHKGVTIARKMKQGKSYRAAQRGFLHEFFEDFFGEMLRLGAGRRKQGDAVVNQYNHVQQELRQLTPGEEDLVKAIEEKSLKPAFEVNIRLLASGETQARADEILLHLLGTFSQFDTVERNGFRMRRPFSIKELVFNFSFRNFVPWYKSILNTEEVASIFHFPIHSTETPKLKLVKSKSAPAPPNMPREGLLIGKNVYRGSQSNIYIKKEDRRRHMYIIGQTGTGKSGFLEEMARQDIQNGEGVCIIDPHGELIEAILTHIPAERTEDVILFDPADIEKPVGLNLLEYDRPEQKTFVINEMINIFDKLYDLRQTGGPMFEQYMRNAMLLVMAHPESGSTLMEISKVLADPDFRRFKLDNCDNPIVVDFWTKEAEKAGGEAALANMVPYITSKLTTFVTNDIMRPIISQQKSAFNLREAMDTGKIVLVNLSKGRIGELNANLLGMVIVGKILMSAMSRVDMPQDERRDFYLYIDEFQNVTTQSIASILSEARKYRLNLTMAHQFIQQLTDPIRDAVFGNVGSMVTFRIGPSDSEFVIKQYAPVFSEHDLINVDNFKAFAKIMIEGEVSKPFSMETFPPSKGDLAIPGAIKEFSRNKYGRDRAVVEHELRERLRYSSLVHGPSEAVDSDMPVK